MASKTGQTRELLLLVNSKKAGIKCRLTFTRELALRPIITRLMVLVKAKKLTS